MGNFVNGWRNKNDNHHEPSHQIPYLPPPPQKKELPVVEEVWHDGKPFVTILFLKIVLPSGLAVHQFSRSVSWSNAHPCAAEDTFRSVHGNTFLGEQMGWKYWWALGGKDTFWYLPWNSKRQWKWATAPCNKDESRKHNKLRKTNGQGILHYESFYWHFRTHGELNDVLLMDTNMAQLERRQWDDKPTAEDEEVTSEGEGAGEIQGEVDGQLPRLCWCFSPSKRGAVHTGVQA